MDSKTNKYEELTNSTKNLKKFDRGVNVCKNEALKNRLRALILSKRLSEQEFYHSLNFSRQYWYMISWGIFNTPEDVKIKIANKLNVDSRAIWEDVKNE